MDDDCDKDWREGQWCSLTNAKLIHKPKISSTGKVCEAQCQYKGQVLLVSNGLV